MYLIDSERTLDTRRLQRAHPSLSIRRRVEEQGTILQAWFLSVDVAVAQRRSRLHLPDPRTERDALIAATALVHGLKVVTSNVKDFRPMGVELVNPWD
jgi:predicted nucleic acid-binding protein